MLTIKENSEYEIGFGISKVAGKLKMIKRLLEGEEEIDLNDIHTAVTDILFILEKTHDIMVDVKD